MWTPATRKNDSRNGLRNQSDVTDEEWRVIEPYLPPAKGIGRPRGWPLREIVNGIFYVMRSGCPWRQLPKDLPPWSTVYRWFAAWRDACLFEKINHALVITDRERSDAKRSFGRDIDSQSIKTTEAGGPRGYDAGKKINGRKRHALVDTDGRGLMIEPHPANIQDRDGGGCSCKPPAACFLSSSGSLLMADTPANASPPRPASSSKSSPRARIRSALLFCRADGWSSGSLPGSAATEGLPKISRPASTPPGPSFTPLPSCCSHREARMSFETDSKAPGNDSKPSVLSRCARDLRSRRSCISSARSIAESRSIAFSTSSSAKLSAQSIGRPR